MSEVDETASESWFRQRLRSLKDFLSHYVGGLYNRVGDDHVFLLAGGLSFSIFVCIIPMTLIIFAVIGNVLEKTTVTSEIDALIDRVIPYESYAQHIKDLILTRVDEFRMYKGVAGLLGLAGLLFAASGLFSSMRTVLNNSYNVKDNHSVYVSKLRDIGLVLLVIIYFLLSTTVLPSVGIIEDFASRSELLGRFDLAGLADIAVDVVTTLVIFFAFFIVYLLVPQTKLPKRVVLMSAVSAAAMWKIAELIFGYYIAHVATLTKVYGAYSFLIVVAFWIYYTSIVFILGSLIGQLYRERIDKKYPPRSAHSDV
ncbi:MAG: YihY/virulence factor BrkB family protein [Candidatus Zixiibacteriota bacterium]